MARMILSVDPGKEGGWCQWNGKNYCGYGLMDGEDIISMSRLIRGFTDIADKSKKPRMVIEDQFVNVNRAKVGGKSSNWNTVKKLIVRRARWQSAAELFGWDVQLVMPVHWQKVIKGVPGKNSKERSMVVSSGVIRKKAETHDISDAICIGLYWVTFKEEPR